jgi:Ca-activated chloride channel family protein
MSFAAPYAFLLLPLPLLAIYLLPARRDSYGHLHVPPSIAATLRAPNAAASFVSSSLFLPAIVWLALVTAIAGPRGIVEAQALPASGRDIVLSLDLSGSMAKTDFELDGKPSSRLDAVKRVAAKFVRGRAGDRIGLVIFAESAYFAAPPTFDVEAVARAIEEAAIGISGKSTAIGDGLGLAMKRLAASSAPSRVVILLSDGVNTSGSVKPQGAAELARGLGIKVHTIAMGVRDLAAGGDPDAVDVATLNGIAEASGGEAFRVRTTADLEAVARDIDKMEASATDSPPIGIYREHWIYPAALAFAGAFVLLLWRRRDA